MTGAASLVHCHRERNFGDSLLNSPNLDRGWTLELSILSPKSRLYFIIGSRLEEEKLIRYHGEVYRRYRDRVPGLVPLPWKHLREADEQALIGGRDES